MTWQARLKRTARRAEYIAECLALYALGWLWLPVMLIVGWAALPGGVR